MVAFFVDLGATRRNSLGLSIFTVGIPLGNILELAGIRRTIMVKLYIMCMLMMGMLLCGGCSAPELLEKSSETGKLDVTVMFDLNDEPHLMAGVSAVSLVDSGSIVLTQSSDSHTFPLTISNGNASAAIANLSTGVWVVSVTLFDASDNAVMTGTGNVTIAAGETVATTITVQFVSGTLEIDVNLPAIQAELGLDHMMLLTIDGSLFTTGRNNYNQLGYSTNINANSLVLQKSMDDVAFILSLEDASLAVKSNGTVYVVGRNYPGCLGTGNSDTVSTWTALSGITDVIAGEHTFYTTMLIKNDGTLWAAGDNNTGRFGDGSTVGKMTWTQLSITDVKDVAMGSAHTVVLKSNGQVWVSGYNTYGQLGIPVNTLTPVMDKTSVKNIFL